MGTIHDEGVARMHAGLPRVLVDEARLDGGTDLPSLCLESEMSKFSLFRINSVHQKQLKILPLCNMLCACDSAAHRRLQKGGSMTGLSKPKRPSSDGPIEFYGSETSFDGTLQGGHKPLDPLQVCGGIASGDATWEQRLMCGLGAVGGLHTSTFAFWRGRDPTWRAAFNDPGNYALSISESVGSSYEDHDISPHQGGDALGGINGNEVNSKEYVPSLGIVEVSARINLADTDANRAIFNDSATYFQSLFNEFGTTGGRVYSVGDLEMTHDSDASAGAFSLDRLDEVIASHVQLYLFLQ